MFVIDFGHISHFILLQRPIQGKKVSNPHFRPTMKTTRGISTFLREESVVLLVVIRGKKFLRN